MKAKYNLSIAVPVYNEEKTIETILTKLVSLDIDSYELIIIDDASKDRSHEIITKFFNKHKNVPHVIVRHTHNTGKGAGIKSALKIAKGKYFVVQDADLEYDPQDLVKLLRYAEAHDVQAVYGSRFKGAHKNMAKPNYYANKFYNFLLRRLYNTAITDMHTCHKMVRTDLIKDINMTSDGFSYASELVSKLLRRGITIHEVPISFNGRTKKEGKKIGYVDGINCIAELLAYRVNAEAMLSRQLIGEVVRFGLVGCVGFVLNYGLLLALDHSINHILSEVIAMAVALQVTFVLHDRWTYREKSTDKKGYARKLSTRYSSYLLSNTTGSIITVVSYALLYGHLHRFFALAAGAVLGMLWNFCINRFFIWKHHNVSVSTIRDEVLPATKAELEL